MDNEEPNVTDNVDGVSKEDLSNDARGLLDRASDWLTKHNIDKGLQIASEVLAVTYLAIKTVQTIKGKKR